ncbi:MAG: O-antigen polymerase [Schlesneria sp.]|nr:O-antigen polymerase [Schlesneria sp.]
MPPSPEQPTARHRPPGRMGELGSTPPFAVWQTVLAAMFSTLFFVRFFLPAESAAQGETLWIVALWMVCGLACAVGSWCGALPRVRPDWLDGSVALWIGCQVVSGIAVVLTTGEKRSAMNMTWEWVGLGITWVIVRHLVLRAGARRAIQVGLIATGTVLAGYGLYQHYVSHPQLVAEYGPLFDRLRTATGSEAASIKQRLSQDGVPTEGPALILFEKRLRDSREPLGLFALANTFGGCLAVCLLLAIGEVLLGRQQGASWSALVPLFVAIAVMASCLLLTKSRTAFLGTAVGLSLLVLSQVRLSVGVRRLLWPVALSCGAVAVAAVALLALGGLDKQVLSEAPKSLSYRFQYWQATARLICDHAWLGVGPGNFRQHYLKYKLPVASEEIADPHNLFFDVMATGGISSGVGLLLFLSCAMLASFRAMGATSSALGTRSRSQDGGLAIEQIPYWMALCGAFLAFAGPLLCWGEWEDRVLILGGIWIPVAWGLSRQPMVVSRSQNRSISPEIVMLLAAVVLAIHLLGAGGIAMPAVTQMLIVLLAFSVPPSAEVPSRPKDRWKPILVAVGLVALLAGLAMTALLPVIARRELLREGNLAVSSPRQRERAGSFFRQAAIADSWSPEPWQSLFEWDFATADQSNESFQAAVDDLLQVIQRDPVNFWAPRTLGSMWLQKWQTSHSAEDASQMVRWTTTAHNLYPTNASIYAELAFALDSAGERSQAVTAAKGAVAQDDLYHEHGHVDRYLDESIRQRLSALAQREGG